MSCDDISRYSVSSQSGSKGSEAVSYYLDQDSGQFFSLLEGDGPHGPEYERGRNTGVRRRDKTPTHGETVVGGTPLCVRVCMVVHRRSMFVFHHFIFSFCLTILVDHSLHQLCFLLFLQHIYAVLKKKKHTRVSQTNNRQHSSAPCPVCPTTTCVFFVWGCFPDILYLPKRLSRGCWCSRSGAQHSRNASVCYRPLHCKAIGLQVCHRPVMERSGTWISEQYHSFKDNLINTWLFLERPTAFICFVFILHQVYTCILHFTLTLVAS